MGSRSSSIDSKVCDGPAFAIGGSFVKSPYASKPDIPNLSLSARSESRAVWAAASFRFSICLRSKWLNSSVGEREDDIESNQALSSSLASDCCLFRSVVSLTGESGMTMIVEVEVVPALASRWGCKEGKFESNFVASLTTADLRIKPVELEKERWIKFAKMIFYFILDSKKGKIKKVDLDNFI